jgi:hypothetical protein
MDAGPLSLQPHSNCAYGIPARSVTTISVMRLAADQHTGPIPSTAKTPGNETMQRVELPISIPRPGIITSKL